MRFSNLFGSGLLLLVLPLLGQGDDPPTDEIPKRPTRPIKGKSASTMPRVPRADADRTALPPGSILAVYDNLADALRMVPRAYVLTPDRYSALLDEIDRLRKQLDRPRARTPARCTLKGKIEGNLLTLSAQFDFETEQPGEIVRLACGNAQATGVNLDGRTPRLRSSVPRAVRGDETGTPAGRATEPDGFVVEVDRPGEHQLTLDLVLAIGSEAGRQVLTLDLPRAAITRLDLTMPPAIRDVQLGGKPLAQTLLRLTNRDLAGDLGAVDRLHLSWQTPLAVTGLASIEATGTVNVQLDAREVKTEARLELSVQGGQVKQWRLLVPLRADLKFSATDEARIARIDVDDKKQSSLRTIHLKEAGTVPLTAIVTHVQSAPRPGGKPAAIGPFTVLGAARQKGRVLISNAVADWHVEYVPQADLARRPATEEELKVDANLVAAFAYGPGDGSERRGGLTWLELEVENVRGQGQVRPTHQISLTGEGSETGARWQVQTTFTVTPRWTTQRLLVQLPPGCEFNEDGSYPLPDRVRMIHHPTTRTVEFRLVRGPTEGSLAPFAVKVEGVYATIVDPKSAGKSTLVLPRPTNAIEQEGTITVQAPPGLELIQPDEGSSSVELVRQTIHELAWRFPRRTPDRLALAWQPYRPPVQVVSQADLTLLPGEVQVRQELRYQLPAIGAPTRLNIHLPPAIASRVQLREGGRLIGMASSLRGGQLASVVPTDPRNPRLVLEYTVTLGPRKAAEPVAVPLAVPEQTTRGETRVRVWSDGGLLPGGARGWSEQNIEVVPGHARLPVLVLRADRIDQPLALQLSESEPTLPALIERALVRVELTGNGAQTYRVSYRLIRIASRHLDLELPASMATINLQVKLDGRTIDPERRPDPRGRLVRLRLAPELVRGPAILEVAYRLDPGRLPSGPIGTPLAAPWLIDEPGTFPTRWQITAPSGWVVLGPQVGSGTPVRWGWRGWLLAPRVVLSATDMERWLVGSEPGAVAVPSPGPEPSLVVWQNGAAMHLTHLPQQGWLLACSLGVVLLGVLVWRLSFAGGEKTATWAWLVVIGLVGCLVVVVFLWPTLAGQLAYGCQPGVLVLLVLGGVQWLLHERYRRQVVFLPNFTRSTRTGSSLLRHEAAARPHGEPSTVDAPRSAGSSVERKS